jgi:hypothetical protein
LRLENHWPRPGKLVPTDNLVDFEGCHFLHCETAGGSFVWSGNVNGENWSLVAQHKERFKAAKLKALLSKFIKACPSWPTPETQQMLQCGNFENLKHDCGLGFSRKQNIEALHQKDGSGMFALSKEMLKQIGALNFHLGKI